MFKNPFTSKLKRRTLFKGLGASAVAALTGADEASAALKPRIKIPTYESIGVITTINCVGSLTILSGTLELPEVKLAMEEASRNFVQMDELMEKVGERLGALTGAEYGMVTSGAAGAMTAGTCACIAGGNIEKMLMLPDTAGMKDEVLVPSNHRMQYDRSIWMTGAKMINVGSAAEMESKINDKTGMLFGWGEAFDRGGIKIEELGSLSKKYNIPLMIDAAAEHLHYPVQYITDGADLVAFSGGKSLRGPQCSGLLLGRKDLVKAAFLNMAPHHGYGRPMKVGKEEIMGLLAAVEMWYHGRDHKAEAKHWEELETKIIKSISDIPGVKTVTGGPDAKRANLYPRLTISWDASVVKTTGIELSGKLRSGNPHIEVGAGQYNININPAMLTPKQEIIVGKRIREALKEAVQNT